MKAQWPFLFNIVQKIILPFWLLNSCNCIQLHKTILRYDILCYLPPNIDTHFPMDTAFSLLEQKET